MIKTKNQWKKRLIWWEKRKQTYEFWDQHLESRRSSKCRQWTWRWQVSQRVSPLCGPSPQTKYTKHPFKFLGLYYTHKHCAVSTVREKSPTFIIPRSHKHVRRGLDLVATTQLFSKENPGLGINNKKLLNNDRMLNLRTPLARQQVNSTYNYRTNQIILESNK